mmetsp:Transcript_89712/g.252956  ORF Transcript_89712/g.252956 Transcript_89712/m.252956 type:complete len:85 (+) Transcript_89712:422-676(+)
MAASMIAVTTAKNTDGVTLVDMITAGTAMIAPIVAWHMDKAMATQAGTGGARASTQATILVIAASSMERGMDLGMAMVEAIGEG